MFSSPLESNLVVSKIDQYGIDQCGNTTDIHPLLTHHVGVAFAHDEREALRGSGKGRVVDDIGI